VEVIAPLFSGKSAQQSMVIYARQGNEVRGKTEVLIRLEYCRYGYISTFPATSLGKLYSNFLVLRKSVWNRQEIWHFI